MEGRTVVLSGATSGLGRSKAEQMAALGARLVLIARNEDKAVRAVDEIARLSGNPEFRDKWGLLHVIDDGEGVDPVIGSALFTDFVRDTGNLPSSVGLGLAVSKSLAEAVGGTLEYERRNMQTDFCLRLPLA